MVGDERASRLLTPPEDAFVKLWTAVMRRPVRNILRRLAKQAVSKDARFRGSPSIAGPLCVLRDAPSGSLGMLRAALCKGLPRER
jgi:hypothetical protein